MIGGASLPELGFVAVLVVLVLLAPLAPRIGEKIGGLFEKKGTSSGKPRQYACFMVPGHPGSRSLAGLKILGVLFS